nr:MAG TPA: hypothetical protein [Caudoviricetes sp.]
MGYRFLNIKNAPYNEKYPSTKGTIMATQISLPVAVAGAIAVSAFSVNYGKKIQKKFYKNLFKLSFTSKNEMARKLANRIIFEDLRVKFDPIPEDD